MNAGILIHSLINFCQCRICQSMTIILLVFEIKVTQGINIIRNSYCVRGLQIRGGQCGQDLYFGFFNVVNIFVAVIKQDVNSRVTEIFMY